MKIDVALIGGTGIGERLAALDGSPVEFETPFGPLTGSALEHDGIRILLVSRHSKGHKVPPHRVNYRAMAAGLASAGVRGCIATAAVGSLRPDWGPGTFVTCTDFLDFTNRQLTLFDDEVVHTDFTEPFSPAVNHALHQALHSSAKAYKSAGVYVCTNGPRYETPHEIRTYHQLGGEIIGMTAASEAILMREAKVPYGCLAIVTNLAAGIGGAPLSHDEVVQVMKIAGEQAVEIILQAAHHIAAS